MITKTGCFNDEKCTCPECGNTHELYGGKGYEEVQCNAFSDGMGGGYYRHVVQRKVCGAMSEFYDGAPHTSKARR